jgi:hypothetical protein
MSERAGFLQDWFAAHVFVPLHGTWFWVAVVGVALAAALGFCLLAALPPALRRRLIIASTFVGGLFFSVDFFWPTRERSPLLALGDLRQPAALAAKLRAARDPVSRHLRGQLPPATQRLLDEYRDGTRPSDRLRKSLVNGLNRAVQGPSLYDRRRFAQVTLTDEIRDWLSREPADRDEAVTNRLLLDVSYSREIAAAPLSSPTHGYVNPLGVFLQVLGAFGLGLGLISLFAVHGKRLFGRKEGGINSVAFFAAFAAMVVAGFWQHYTTDPSQLPPTVTGKYTGPQAFYEVCFNGMLNALGSTMFSTLAFFITAAAYRAFRIRSVEATVMMVTAFLVMLGGVPVGRVLTSWIPDQGAIANLRLEYLSNWILTAPNAAVFRGIIFGSTIGSMAMALRVWLSLERGAYFDQRT